MPVMWLQGLMHISDKMYVKTFVLIKYNYNKGDGDSMATVDKLREGIEIGRYKDNVDKLAKDLNKYIKGDITFLCIGTDRSTGDSLAPFIGTMLEEKGYKNVLGTIDNPVHAKNLDERITEILPNTTIVAIDASLGKERSVGKITFNKGKLYPGKALDKDLTPVGDFNITGTVNMSGYMEFAVLQNTRLSTVLKMAKNVTSAIEKAFPLENKFLFEKVQ